MKTSTIQPATIRYFLIYSLFLLALFYTNHTRAQNNSLTGHVHNATGEPLQGVTIKQKEGTLRVQTDADGSFTIPRVGSSVLIISLVGYLEQEVTINGNSSLQITLQAADAKLDEVIITGYRQQKRSTYTGASATVNASELANQPGAAVNDRIQGLAPGLQISSNSGIAGGSTFVRLRGTTSVNAGNDPLYIIDNVFINSESLQGVRIGGQTTNPLADINPADIETIEVLKDANATAIYGSRGANGVIIITTKRGSKEGPTRVTLNSQYGFAHYDKLWDLSTGPQHAEILNEAYINDGGSYESRPYRPINEVINGVAGQGNPEDQGTYDRLGILFRTAAQQTHNLSISGGNSKTSFYIGGEFSDQPSIIRLQDFRRHSYRTNLDHKISEKLAIGVSASYAQTKRQLVRTGDTGGILNTGIHTPTLTPIFKVDGSYNNAERFNNPYILLENSNNHAYGKRFIGNFFAKWDILPGLSFKTSWSLDNNDYRESFYFNANLNEGKGSNGSATEALSNDKTWIAEQLLNYNKDFGENHLAVFLGNTIQRNDFQRQQLTGTNFPSIEFKTIASAAITTAYDSGTISSGLLSYFGGANYSYQNKYNLDVNLRADASSRFGSQNRWGYFPSAGVSWRVSEERFIRENIPFFNELKIKSSIGWTGNQNISDFASLTLWNGGNNYLDLPGISPTQLGNDNLKWETTRQLNIGLESSFLNNLFSVEFNYYNKYTSDLLLSVPAPAKTGFSATLQNLGEMSNKGIEFQLTARPIQGEHFRWTSSFNISHNKNLIEKLPASFTQYNRDWVRLEQGHSMYSFWLYKQLYVDSQTGNAVYEDINNDGKITADDRHIVGDAWPTYYGGFRNEFSYKNFDFNFLLYFSQGNKVFNMNRYFQEHAGSRGTSWSLQESMMRRWQQPGDITDIPRVTNLPNPDGSYNHNFESSRFLEDGSFIRLRNVTLGYTFDKGLTKRIGIQSLRIYTNATNLFTITNYSGADPEVNVAQDLANQTVQGLDFSIPPHARTIEFGINATF